jgi:hypothetical protein
MDAQTSRREDDLSAIERRLAAWQPASEHLDADAMLFAAGRAAAGHKRASLFWPVLCALLAVQVVGLGVWGLSERAGRLDLAGRLPERAPAIHEPSSTAVAVLPESSSIPSPDGYFNLRRRMEQDPNRWLASLPPQGSQPLEPPPQPDIIRVGQRERLIAQ